MKILGRHLIVEFADCNHNLLDDEVKMEQFMKDAVKVSGATIVKSSFHRYNPQGVSGVIVIAESHLSIHTWPEYGYAAVDFFTCGDSVDPYKAYDHMREMLECKNPSIFEVKRGIPSEFDEVIDHKPVNLFKQTVANAQ